MCDQQRRHIGQLQRKGDLARGATCVEFVNLLQLLGGAPCLAIVGLTLAPISDDISLASLRQLADRSIDWRLQGEGTPRLVPNSVTIGLTVRDSLEPGQG